MSGTSDIRAGGAYVELYAEDSRLQHDLGRIATHLTGLVGITRMAFSATAVYMASVNLESARMTGTITEAYQAELKMNDAIGEMIGEIPLIGRAIRHAFDAFGDREAIEKAIKNIAEIETAIKTMEQKARQWAQETAIARAQLAGDKVEEERLRAGGEQEKRSGDISDAQRKFALIQQERARAEVELAKSRAMQAAMTKEAQGFDPFSLFAMTGLNYKNKAAFQMKVVADLTEKERTAMADLQAMIAASQNATAAANAKVDATREEAKKKRTEDAWKQLETSAREIEQVGSYTATDDFERRRMAEMAHHTDMLLLAQKYNLDREALAKAHKANMDKIAQDEIAAREKKQRDIQNAGIEQEQALTDPGIGYAKRAEARKMDQLIQKDPEQAKRVLRDQIDQAKATAMALAEEARKKLQESLADSVYTETERADVSNATRNAVTATDEYLRKQEQLDTLMNQPGSLLEGADVTQTFNAVASFGMGLGTNAQERAANASEETAKNTKRVADAAEKGLAFTP